MKCVVLTRHSRELFVALFHDDGGGAVEGVIVHALLDPVGGNFFNAVALNVIAIFYHSLVRKLLPDDFASGVEDGNGLASVLIGLHHLCAKLFILKRSCW